MNTKPLYIALIATFSAAALVTGLYFSGDYMGMDSPYDTEVLIVQPNNYLSANQKTARKRSVTSLYRAEPSLDEAVTSYSSGSDPHSSNDILISHQIKGRFNSASSKEDRYTKRSASELESGSSLQSSASNLFGSKQNSSSENTAFQQSAVMSMNNAYAANRSPFANHPIGVDPDNPDDEDMGSPLPVSGGGWILVGLTLIYAYARKRKNIFR